MGREGFISALTAALPFFSPLPKPRQPAGPAQPARATATAVVRACTGRRKVAGLAGLCWLREGEAKGWRGETNLLVIWSAINLEKAKTKGKARTLGTKIPSLQKGKAIGMLSTM